MAVTFVDPNMPGDLTPLISDSTKLTGIGSIVDIREAVKGSEAISTKYSYHFQRHLIMVDRPSQLIGYK